jgi:hypothetical protein
MAHYVGKNFIIDLYSLKFARKLDKTSITSDGKPVIEMAISSDENNNIIYVEFDSPTERDTEYTLLVEAIARDEKNDYHFFSRDSDERSLSSVLGGIVEYFLGPTVTSKPSRVK